MKHDQRIRLRFRSNKQDQSEKRENTDLQKERRWEGESREIGVAGGCGGDEWRRWVDARTLIGGRCVDGVWWRSSGGATLVGFGNCGCEFN